jgi:hypothetical protein
VTQPLSFPGKRRLRREIGNLDAQVSEVNTKGAEIDIVLEANPRGAFVTGQIVGPEGPLAGALISPSGYVGASSFTRATATTALDGRFRLGLLPLAVGDRAAGSPQSLP